MATGEQSKNVSFSIKNFQHLDVVQEHCLGLAYWIIEAALDRKPRVAEVRNLLISLNIPTDKYILPENRDIFEKLADYFEIIISLHDFEERQILAQFGDYNRANYVYLTYHKERNIYGKIKNLEWFEQNFFCKFCNKTFLKCPDRNKHEKNCQYIDENASSKLTKLLFPEHFEKLKFQKTFPEKIRQVTQLSTDEEKLLYYDFMVVADCESLLSPIRDVENADISERLPMTFENVSKQIDHYSYVEKHTAFLIGAMSNLPNDNEVNFFSRTEKEPSQDLMIDNFLKYLSNCSKNAEKIMTKKLEFLFTRLQGLEDFASTNYKKRICRAITELQLYCRQIPIFFYNGRNYDLPLIRPTFFAKLRDRFDKKDIKIINRNNSYLLVSTPGRSTSTI